MSGIKIKKEQKIRNTFNIKNLKTSLKHLKYIIH